MIQGHRQKNLCSKEIFSKPNCFQVEMIQLKVPFVLLNENPYKLANDTLDKMYFTFLYYFYLKNLMP